MDESCAALHLPVHRSSLRSLRAWTIGCCPAGERCATGTLGTRGRYGTAHDRDRIIPSRLRMSDMADWLCMALSGITRVVDRLVERGP
jgi:hypothetical protein